MPAIMKTVAELRPNTADPNNSNSESTWFSYIRRVYFRQYRGTILPPTKTEFIRLWNAANQCFSFSCNGENFQECKESLCRNAFPFQGVHNRSLAVQENNTKAQLWTRMIMAFNMYAAVRKEFRMYPHNNVDFIGSAMCHIGRWEPRFHDRCILYISNEKINSMFDMIYNGQFVEFWRLIMFIYDEQRTAFCFHALPERTNNDNTVPIVDAPTHNIAREYLNRIDEDETEMVLNNQQIANIIIRSENPLPRELSKTIYDICMALYISHPV